MKTTVENDQEQIDHQVPGNDKEDLALYKRASLRAGFKVHLAIFILVNLLFWVIWYFIFRGGTDPTSSKAFDAVLFVSIAWFIIVIGHYLFAYKWNKSLVEKEFRTLKKEVKKKENQLDTLKKENESKQKKLDEEKEMPKKLD